MKKVLKKTIVLSIALVCMIAVSASSSTAAKKGEVFCFREDGKLVCYYVEGPSGGILIPDKTPW